MASGDEELEKEKSDFLDNLYNLANGDESPIFEKRPTCSRCRYRILTTK